MNQRWTNENNRDIPSYLLCFLERHFIRFFHGFLFSTRLRTNK